MESTNHPCRGRAALTAGLALLAGLLLFGRPGDPLLEPEEARNAEVPRQMLARGEWLVPVYHGQPYYDKPPLLWWLVMLSYKTFGVSDAAARVPARLAAFLCVAVLTWWGRRALGWRAALAGGVVLCLSVRYIHLARMLTIDVLLALAVTLALTTAHRALAGSSFRRGWWLASAAAAALGLLTKGPVALVLVLSPLVVWLAVTRTARPRWWDWPVYLAVACVLASPWFAAVSLRDPGFVDHFFWRHHVLRYVEPFDHPEPFWFYLPELALGLFPWVLVLPSLARTTVQGGRSPARRKAALRFLLVVAVTGVVFFSLSGCKRSGYLVPLLPPLALALGAHLCRRPHAATGRFALAAVVVSTAGIAVAAWSQSLLGPVPAAVWLAFLTCGLAALWVSRRGGKTPSPQPPPRSGEGEEARRDRWPLCLLSFHPLSASGRGLGGGVASCYPITARPWSLTGVVLGLGLLGAIHLVWPALCERFCLRTQAHLHARRAYDEGVPVLCYPGRKDSFSFYLGDRPLTCYGREQRGQLLSDLERHPRALLFVRSTREDGLLRELPPGLEVTVDRRPGLMFAVWLRRRPSPPSTGHEAAEAPPPAIPPAP